MSDGDTTPVSERALAGFADPSGTGPDVADQTRSGSKVAASIGDPIKSIGGPTLAVGGKRTS